MEADDDDSVLRLSEHLVVLYKQGLFRHVFTDTLLQRAQNPGLNVRRLKAFKENRWDEAISICDEWLKLNKKEMRVNPRAGDMIIDSRKYYQIARYNDAVERLTDRCEFKRALEKFPTLNGSTKNSSKRQRYREIEERHAGRYAPSDGDESGHGEEVGL